MPKSKRDKQVSLTKTDSKGRELKMGVITKLREALDEHKSLYVFSFDNMRSAKFKDVRIDWRDSRFFLGKNKVMQKAFGVTPEDEFRDNLRHLAKRLVGQVGVLATSRDRDEVVSYFEGHSVPDFAKSGSVAPRTIIIDPQDNTLKFFPTTMFNLFRKLGLNLEVKDGELRLLEPFTACTEGQPITPEQAKLLTQLDMPLVDFKIKLLCRWSDGEFEDLE